MESRLYRRLFTLVLPMLLASVALAQQEPGIGYVYPAGGERGTTVEVVVGGQFLTGVHDVVVSGDGIQGTIVEHTKPMTQKRINELRQKLQEIAKEMQGSRGDTNTPNRKYQSAAFLQRAAFLKAAEKKGITTEEVLAFLDYRKRLSDPKRQLNPQISETVRVRLEIAPDVEPGQRQLRLVTPLGISNPRFFQVGAIPEYNEAEPNDKRADSGVQDAMPVLINGQILPGDVDRFSFNAKKGMQIVAAVSARELIPYLADAVPGWFQATLVLYDADGNEVAYADDFRYHPDPVLCYEIPEDGTYVLEITDAVYRGREDFVYRVAVGEIPYIASIFPLGGPLAETTTVNLAGWNLPTQQIDLPARYDMTACRPFQLAPNRWATNAVTFARGESPETLDHEPNDGRAQAQPLSLPTVVNGRIDRSGDLDFFSFRGQAGQQLVVEVHARRLQSPLDSIIELTDSTGKRTAVNDDNEDHGSGLTTHHADSRFSVTLPDDGQYVLRLGDTQRHGGNDYAYRLRIDHSQPDFELRVVPSSINMSAGQTVPITVYALRRDGFEGDIKLSLAGSPDGFKLSGAWVPGGQEQVQLTLTAPPAAGDQPLRLNLEGTATIDGQVVRRRAVPAEDMMQAFIYHHLVPSQDLLVFVNSRGRARARVQVAEAQPVAIPAGATKRIPLMIPRFTRQAGIELALNNAPEGITLQDVVDTRQGMALVLAADADKVAVGLKGNLIVDAFVVRNMGTKTGNKRRVAVGTLPAISFEVVER